MIKAQKKKNPLLAQRNVDQQNQKLSHATTFLVHTDQIKKFEHA
jgi:hypothetical protein